MARRFVVKENDIKKIDENLIEIIGSEVKHIQVLRHKIGDEITVNEYISKIKYIKKESIILEIVSYAKSKGIPNSNITLYMGMLKGDKMDFVVKKAVELGVKEIVPFFSKNVVVKLDEKQKEKRKEKFEVIAVEACKQCGRTDNITINNFLSFNELLNDVSRDDICFFAYENEKESLKDIIKEVKNKNEILKNIGIIIGAEGGFDKSEADKLKKQPNVKITSLGSRILMAETAALNLTSIIMYEFENGFPD